MQHFAGCLEGLGCWPAEGLELLSASSSGTQSRSLQIPSLSCRLSGSSGLPCETSWAGIVLPILQMMTSRLREDKQGLQTTGPECHPPPGKLLSWVGVQWLNFWAGKQGRPRELWVREDCWGCWGCCEDSGQAQVFQGAWPGPELSGKRSLTAVKGSGTPQVCS